MRVCKCVHSCTWLGGSSGSSRAWDMNRSELWEAVALWGMEFRRGQSAGCLTGLNNTYSWNCNSQEALGCRGASLEPHLLNLHRLCGKCLAVSRSHNALNKDRSLPFFVITHLKCHCDLAAQLQSLTFCSSCQTQWSENNYSNYSTTAWLMSAG